MPNTLSGACRSGRRSALPRVAAGECGLGADEPRPRPDDDLRVGPRELVELLDALRRVRGIAQRRIAVRVDPQPGGFEQRVRVPLLAVDLAIERETEVARRV